MEEEQYPNYTALREGLNDMAMGPTSVPVGKNENAHENEILKLIREGSYSSMLSQSDLVQGLAAQGHSIETVANALDESPEEIEALADAKFVELARKLEGLEEQ